MLAAVCMPSITDPATIFWKTRQATSFLLRVIDALVDGGRLEENEIEGPSAIVVPHATTVGLGWLGGTCFLGGLPYYGGASAFGGGASSSGGGLPLADGGLSPSEIPGLGGAVSSFGGGPPPS